MLLSLFVLGFKGSIKTIEAFETFETFETFKTIKMVADNAVMPDLAMVVMVVMVLKKSYNQICCQSGANLPPIKRLGWMGHT